MEVPALRFFREVVDHILDNRNRALIELLYLTAARVSELVSKTCASDMKLTEPYGQHLDYGFANFQKPKDTFLMKIAVLKRSKYPKNVQVEPKEKLFFKVIALPTNPSYEPWVLDILKYLSKKKDKVILQSDEAAGWENRQERTAHDKPKH